MIRNRICLAECVGRVPVEGKMRRRRLLHSPDHLPMVHVVAEALRRQHQVRPRLLHQRRDFVRERTPHRVIHLDRAEQGGG